MDTGAIISLFIIFIGAVTVLFVLLYKFIEHVWMIPKNKDNEPMPGLHKPTKPAKK